MPTCCAIHCDFRTGKLKTIRQLQYEENIGRSVSLHIFPKNPEIRQKWTQATKRDQWVPNKNSALCSKHFAEEDFLEGYHRRILKHNAIPHIFQELPKYFQDTNNNKRRKLDYSKRPEPKPSTSSFSSDDIPLCPPPVPQDIVSPTKSELKVELNNTTSKFKKKVKTLQQSLRRKVKKIASLKNVLHELQTKNLVNTEEATLLSNLGSGNVNLLKLIGRGKRQGKKYPEELRAFALTLHYYSPKAYRYVRSTFNSVLPHSNTIYRWYKSVDGKAGFTTEAFNALKAKGAERKVFYSLMVDEMAIRQFVEFDGKAYHGYVDYGVPLEKETNTIAKNALVFMLVALNGNWKVPVGYFLTRGVSGDQQANLVKQCLALCHENSIDVVSLTFDGTSCNLAMTSSLGCDAMNWKAPKFDFPHPVTGVKLYVFPDPCHMVKLIRNTLGERKVLTIGKSFIRWQYIEKLHEVQKKEGLRLGNKLNQLHISYQKQKMKVKLATQVFSKSVADAIETANEDSIDGFEGSEATVEFIRLFNDLFDIFNSMSLRQLRLKKPISPSNWASVKTIFAKADSYILKLRLNDVPIVESPRKVGFQGFRICIKCLSALVQSLVYSSPPKLLFLATYKFSQDHLELFFGQIRAAGGFNNNPTVRQFVSAYKKQLVHMELHADRSGNCIPLENISILTCNSTEIIRLTSCIDAEVVPMPDPIPEDHDYIPGADQITLLTSRVVEYIAGFVSRSLSKVLRCEPCILALVEWKHFHCALINKKNMGGLVTPSSDVVKICMLAEKVFRQSLSESGGVFMNPSFSLARMNITVFKRVIDKDIFSCLNEHMFDQGSENNHLLHLIKSVSQKYLSIRCYHVCKYNVNAARSDRVKFNKLVLFSGN